MISTCLTLVAMLAFVLFPLLIPLTVDAVHAGRSWAAARATRSPRRTSPRRLAFAAA
jgi:hypothetical protein